jgi:hypothetical protein
MSGTCLDAVRRVGKAAGRERLRRGAHQSARRRSIQKNGEHGAKSAFAHPTDFKQQLDQPQFQTGPIGVRVQQGPKLPPL